MKSPKLKPMTQCIVGAFACTFLAIPVTSYADMQSGAADAAAASGDGGVATVVVSGYKETAAKSALSQGSLDARSAQSIVGDSYVRNFNSPIADFSQVFQITPGAFSYSPNGVGMGNAGTTVRGLTDSQYLVTFDGIPFNDTNGVSHHSYVFFPNMTVGGAVVDRSPGSAATIGQATFGGSLNLLSRELEPAQRTSVTGSYGTWDTRMLVLEHETGQFGQDGDQNLMINAQQMKSDGYQTYNNQDRKAFSAKYQYNLTPSTVFTAFTSVMEVKNNQLDAGAPTRAQIAKFGDNYLNSNDPTQSNYFGYNLYDVTTNFQYVGITSNLGNGWKVDDKLYNYGYMNRQKIGGTPVSSAMTAASETGIDKFNSYHTTGNLLRFSQDSGMGTLRTGLWLEYANSDRHQISSNELNGWQDAPAPRFSETYQTKTAQPYIEYEFKISDDLKITPGLKYAHYEQDYDHLQDLKKVGPLGGTINKLTNSITGGLPSVSNSATYSDFLPTLDVHYMLRPNWSTYAQFAAGDLIPPTSVYDAPFAKVAIPPKAQKSSTIQFGTDWKSDAFTFDANVYHVKLDNSYTCNIDPVDPTTQICVASGTEITEGLEVEGTALLGNGFSLYANGTVGSTKYSGGALDGKWVAGAPGNTETLGLIYAKGAWNSAAYAKRVGKLYNDGITTGSYVINPVVLTNLFVNYTIKHPTSFSKQAKVQLAVNNLFDKHSITGISGNASTANPSAADLITLLPARSVTLSVTVDF
ncbi:MAG: TonB-dependent receptor [Collimonas sp.]|uniref:TonB-dependent receptor n=1 Tax=Collimonas sp. TaxID=1963772 RepID=UPI0032647609